MSRNPLASEAVRMAKAIKAAGYRLDQAEESNDGFWLQKSNRPRLHLSFADADEFMREMFGHD